MAMRLPLTALPVGNPGAERSQQMPGAERDEAEADRGANVLLAGRRRFRDRRRHGVGDAAPPAVKRVVSERRGFPLRRLRAHCPSSSLRARSAMAFAAAAAPAAAAPAAAPFRAPRTADELGSTASSTPSIFPSVIFSAPFS